MKHNLSEEELKAFYESFSKEKLIDFLMEGKCDKDGIGTTEKKEISGIGVNEKIKKLKIRIASLEKHPINAEQHLILCQSKADLMALFGDPKWMIVQEYISNMKGHKGTGNHRSIRTLLMSGAIFDIKNR